ncbi:MAG: MFS transporter [Candidatus Competibacterales bacterium]
MSTLEPVQKLSFIPALRGSWALLVGICLLMLGNGLQGTLLGIRADIEGFGSVLTGLVMAAFFAGFLVGAVWTPQAVGQVGHIRVFAALAALASAAILVHGVLVDPWIWGGLRFVTGVCFAGIFVVAESWLNVRVDNAGRGHMLAVYMLTTFGGMGGGQLLLNTASPRETDLFILVSVLISVAVLPILLTAVPAPVPGPVRSVSLGRLWGASPLGVAGTFAAGIVNGAAFGMGAVYAQRMGFSLLEVSLFMMALIAGAALCQWPIGRLSDVFDRRVVITGITLSAAGLALGLGLLSTAGARLDFGAFVAIVVAFGGISLSLHSLSLAYTNDYLEPTEMVGASSGLVLILGMGSLVGPLAAGLALSVLGPWGFFALLGLVHLAVGGFALWRMTQRASPPSEDQGPYIALPANASAVATTAAEKLHAEELVAGSASDGA